MDNPHTSHHDTRRIHLPTVDSTNLFVREMLQEEGTGGVRSVSELPGFTLVTADDQTCGRGQKGNSWETEQGKNLIFSLLCHPDFVLASRQFVLSQSMALALRDALSRRVEGVSVKWPNDIYVGDKKISGTLIECDLSGKRIENCIIGVGLNVNQTEFRSDAPNPTSLRLLTGRDHDREALLAEVVDAFLARYDRLAEGDAEEIRREYMAHLYRREGFHRYADARGEFVAEVAGVEPTGHLLLRLDGGRIVRYEFKDVRFVNDR